MKKYMNILEKCPLFKEMDREEVIKMMDCLEARVIKAVKNQIIFSEGEPAGYMGVVLSGNVRILREDYYGNRNIVAEVGPSELFAEAFAAAGVTEMPVSAVASADSRILLMDAGRALSACTGNCTCHAKLIKNLLQVAAAKNMILNQKLDIISKRSTREKLMTYLLYEAKKRNSLEFEIPYDRQELADFLGVDRSAMSAEIARMRRDGLIASEKSRFVLHRQL